MIYLIQKIKSKNSDDAFNYNQWDYWKVIRYRSQYTVQGEQAFFKVRCALNTTAMQLQSGYKTHVSKGMTLTTRYIITDVVYMNYCLIK
jgi:HlyD family secretion protein